MKPATIALSVQLESQFNEMVRVARLLREEPDLRPHFLFYRPTPRTLSTLIERCREEGFDFSFRGRVPEPAPASVSASPGKARDRFPKPRSRTALLLRSIDFFQREFRRLVGERSFATSKLQELDLKLLVVPEDGVGGPLPFIHAFKQRGLPVLSIPYEFSTVRQPLEAIRSTPQSDFIHGMANPLNRWIARKYPHWAHQDRDSLLLRSPAAQIIIWELLGYRLPHPWAVHGGDADILIAESEKMMEDYRASGIPESKVRLLGSLSYDTLSHARDHAPATRASLLQETGGVNSDKLCLVALPPDLTALRPQGEFQNYRDLLTFWVKTTSTLPGIRPLYQFHPRISESDRDFVRSLGVTCTSQDPARLVSSVDLLVTSVSSIIRWACCCGVPVVNYDVYRYHYPDYDSAPGVLTMESRESFRMTLDALTSADRFQQVRQAQEAGASRWGTLDGRNGRRMIDLITSTLPALG
jgi:hypothetical protein